MEDLHIIELFWQRNESAIKESQTKYGGYSLSEEQIDVFHKILDCVSETAASEMRAAYKDGITLMKEVQA